MAYKSLALKNHPDKNIGDPSAADRFRAISRAYEVLANPEHKKRYDIALRVALASYGGIGSSSSHLRSNPYTVDPVSMSDLYREAYARQAERATTRGSRTTSASPRDAAAFTTRTNTATSAASSSQYTKAQQDLFRKHERERQQELRRQIEKEKREQRDRERAALRREQEKQEELLQQRWQQQQQQQQRSAATRASTRTAGTRRTASTGTSSARQATASASATMGSGREAESGSRSMTPRQQQPRNTPRATAAAAAPSSSSARMEGGGLSGRSARAAPNTVRVATPARNVTPRMRQRPGASTPSPGRRGDRHDGTPTPTSMAKEEYGEGEEAWHSSLSSSADDSLPRNGSRASLDSDSSMGDVDAGGTACSNHPRPFMGFTTAATEPGTQVGTADASVLLRSHRHPTVAAASTASSAADFTRNGSGSNGRERKEFVGVRKTASPRPTPQQRPTLGTTGASSTASATAPAAARTHSPRVAASYAATRTTHANATPTTPPRRGLTPNGRSTTHARATSPASATPRTALTTSPQRTPRMMGTTGSTTAAAPPSRTHSGASGLAEADKELLEKRRRERLAKEKERQRLVRLAEEERQFKRAARTLKAEQAANGAAAAAAAELSQAELVEYLFTDEASARQQFIEREEQLAWRRLQRQHIAFLAEAVFQKKFAAVAVEEARRRSGIVAAAWQAHVRLRVRFDEWAGRCAVEWREGRDRRQLKGRAVADGYHVQRLSRARAVLCAEEAAQRQARSAAALRALAAVHVMEAEEEQRLCVSMAEAAARSAHFSFDMLSAVLQEETRAFDKDCGAQAEKEPSAAALADDDFSSPMSLPAAFKMATDTPRSPVASSSSNVAATEPPVQAPATIDGSSNHATLDSSSSGEQCGLTVSPASDRRLLQLCAEEARQRSLLTMQQHHEEVALRRRRANALHRRVTKEKEEAVRQAQRMAQTELRALQAELRLLQRQRDASVTLITTPPQQNESFSSSASLPRLSVLAATGHEESQPTSATSAAAAAPPPPTTSSATAVFGHPSLAVPAAAPRRRHVVSPPSSSGWRALQFSDGDDHEEELVSGPV